MNKYYKYFLLILILVLSFLLGSRMILSGDFYFLYDQARDLMLVKNIAVEHKLTLIGSRSGIGGFFHGPLYLYLLLPFFYLGEGNPLAFTPFFIIIGLITIVIGYIVGKKLYNQQVGILVAFFLAVSPRIWGYFSSTQGINLVPLLYLGLFYSLILYLRGNRNMFIWTAFFTGLTFQFETATALILVLVVTSLYFFLPKAILKWKIIISSIGVFVLTLSSFILFDLRHQFLMTKSLLTYIFQGNKNEPSMSFLSALYNHYLSVLGVYKSVLVKDTLILQILMILVVILALWFVFKKKIKNQIKKEFFLFAFFPIITFIFLLFYRHIVYPEYILGLTISVAFFISLCIYINKDEKFMKLISFIFIFVSLIQAIILIFNQYSKPYKELGAGSFKNQKAVVDWIFKDAKNEKFGYFVFTNEIFTSQMDYLMWWEGNKIYNNVPTDTKQPITYLIMYMPTIRNDKGAHIYWKENVVRTKAKVLKEKFLYDITIQKLQIPEDEQPADPNYYQNLIFR